MSSVTDIDGNIYDTVKIGNLLWTTSNLRVTRFNNGLAIDKNSGFCSYNYDDLISKKFGHLYSCGSIWHSNTAQTFDYQPEHHVIQSLLPPLGWEIPTLDDWISLKATLGIGKPNLTDNCSYNYCSPEIEHAMKSIDSWEIGGNGSNESGLNILAGGFLSYERKFLDLNRCATIWLGTVSGPDLDHYHIISVGINSSHVIPEMASVRVVKRC